MTNGESAHFLELLGQTVDTKKDKVFATWYNIKAKPTDKYTFQGIWNEAGSIAHDLLTKDKLEKGDKVILCYNFGLQFFSAFLGCLRAGVVAVLVYPPSPQNLSKALPKMTKIIDDCDAKAILIDETVNLLRLNPLSKSRKLWPQNIKFKVHPKKAKLATISQNQLLHKLNEINSKDPITSNDLAFLQYTSGSTGDPKGVMVTFGALKANVQGIVTAVNRVFASAGRSTEDIIGLSWLPQYHDMGLIYAIVSPFYGGWNCNMISPFDFIKNPLLWIELMSSLRVNWSVAPNFAYRLAARKFIEGKKIRPNGEPKEPIPNLDLSSIVYLQNAAEPIQLDTKNMFEEAFGNYGLSQNWFMAGYGLAESVVYVTDLHEYQLSTFKPANEQPSVAVGHRRDFQDGQIAKIVHPETLEELEDQQVGELWLSGPSITAGYFGKSSLTKDVFQAKIGASDKNFLRTGDLAFFEDDYLYICGRQKDLIIVNGVNHYPQDIENVVQSATKAVRPGCVAAFSSDNTGADGDLEVVFEVRREYEPHLVNIVKTIRTKIIEEIGIAPSRVVAIKERSILKTTSGKIQRKANRNALHDGSHNILREYEDSAIGKSDHGTTDSNTSSNSSSNFLDDRDTFDKVMVAYFGHDFDESKSWDELGLTSMVSISLKDSIADCFAITLDPDCFDQYSTPSELKAFVMGNQGAALETHLPLLPSLGSMKLSWVTVGLLQALCSVVLVFIFSISVAPAWYIGKLFATMNASTTLHALGTAHRILWVWFPVIVPVWMVSLSLLTILLKWIIIWKYKEGIVPVPSLLYFRWWMVDRAVALWEFWVGRFIVNTPLIKLFYFLMGAKVHRSVSIEAFIREFDLVQIEEHSSLQYQVHSRKFGAWNEDESPSLEFRPIYIGINCIVKGVVSVGASVRDNAIIDKLSVVPEGARVSAGGHVVGNPGYDIKHASSSTMYKGVKQTSCFLGALKLLWLGIELYLFFAVMLLGQYLWVSHLPTDWEYADLLKWCLLIVWFSVASILTSIMLKWVLIGKRVPGPAKETVWTTFADWAVDWHFQVGTGLLLSVTTHSRLWNIVLMMHGMDLDISSKIAGVGSFLPSKIDLIKVKNSFISVATFNTKSHNQYHQTTITDSSIGLLVDMSPKSDMNITNSIVPPMTHLTSSISQDKQDPRVFNFTSTQLFVQEILMSFGYLVSFGLLFCTLVPSYELWMNVFGNPSSIWMAVPALACSLLLQTIVWTLVFACFQHIALIKSQDSAIRPFSKTLYSLYGTMAFAYQNYSFVNAFLGSPAFNIILKILGVTIEGRALLYPHRMYEYSHIAVADRTIIDGSQITGHYVIYGDVVLGPCKVSGIMHEGSYAANAFIVSDESEHMRAFVGNYDSAQDTKHFIDDEEMQMQMNL